MRTDRRTDGQADRHVDSKIDCSAVEKSAKKRRNSANLPPFQALSETKNGHSVGYLSGRLRGDTLYRKVGAFWPGKQPGFRRENRDSRVAVSSLHLRISDISAAFEALRGARISQRQRKSEQYPNNKIAILLAISGPPEGL